MDQNDHSGEIVRFGVFEADLRTGELRKSGVRVPLPGQPFQVCALLLEHAGELVTREELRLRIWAEDTFVDFDQALNAAVSKIRIALGDNADNPRFVETLHRRGYRFIAPVERVSFQPSPIAPERHFWRLKTNRVWLIASTTTLLLLSGLGMWRSGRKSPDLMLPTIEVAPLVGLPGFESDPAFSPDGNQVAFTLRGPEISGIYTTVVGGEKPLRVTSNTGDSAPRWSPDGRQIAFARPFEDGVAIYTIPASGGTEHRLYAGPADSFPDAFDWSPDGKVLAFSQSSSDKTHSWIALLSPVDFTTRRLTAPSGQELDYLPAFSPNGSEVAFVRGITAGVVSDIYIVPAAGGTPRRLTFDNTWIMGPPAWTPDGRDIVFSSTRGGLASLWRISATGGPPRPVAGVGPIAFSPSISRRGNQLVYQQGFFKDTLVRLDLKDEKHRLGPPIVVRSEKGINWRPHFSPDGKRFVFESDRFGYPEIWACDSNGSNCGQLTSLHGTSGAARWSPDGGFIAFEFRPKGHSEVYLLEVGGGTPRLLPTFPGADNGGPNWSRDGKWVYFYSNRGGGSFQLWKVPANGGSPVRITKNGGVFAAESADGRFLYYSKFEAQGIWRMPLNGGEETHILDQPGTGHDAWFNWALARNGIYFLAWKDQGAGVLDFFEFATGKTTTVSALRRSGIGLAVSGDGRSVLYQQNELSESSIMLVKNFR